MEKSECRRICSELVDEGIPQGGRPDVLRHADRYLHWDPLPTGQGQQTLPCVRDKLVEARLKFGKDEISTAIGQGGVIEIVHDTEVTRFPHSQRRSILPEGNDFVGNFPLINPKIFRTRFFEKAKMEDGG